MTETDPEFLTDSEIEIARRADEINEGFLTRPKETTLAILAETIARDEYHAIRTKRAQNIANLSQALKLASEINGIAKSSEVDINIKLPSDPDEALRYVLDLRANGRLKSMQANDLANLSSKLTEQTKVKALMEFVDGYVEQQNRSSASEGSIEMISREDLEAKNEKV